MKEKPKVSVIMSTYKTPKNYLDLAIKSILKQTYKNFEFIIICDGIKEEYEYIKRNYKDERLIVILNKDNIGLAKSLNIAISLSKGKYIVRMDSDDISLKNRIKKQVTFMEKNTNIMVCGMRAKCFGDRRDLKYDFYNEPELIRIQLLFKNVLIHPSIIMRKKFFDDNNIKYNEEFTYSQDFELWSRIANDENIVEIKKIGLKYRVHNKQISIAKKNIQNSFKDRILERNTELIEGNNKKEIIMVLNGEKQITLNNYKRIINELKIFIEDNDTRFKKSSLKKVLYNRILQLTLRKRKLILTIITDKQTRNIILNIENFKYIINKIIYMFYNI